MDEYGYIQFPLSMIRNLIIDPEKTINRILKYGIYNFASKLTGEARDIATQMMYAYYRRRHMLTSSLIQFIDNNIELDEDYNGFRGETFQPEFEIDQIMEHFEADQSLYDESLNWYRFWMACKNLGEINLASMDQFTSDSPDSFTPGEPFVSAKVQTLFQFRDEGKTEDQLAEYAAFIGIKSILGNKPYYKTNKHLIHARMFGFRSIKDVQEFLPNELRPIFERYSKRWHRDKILQALELNWQVMTYNPKGVHGLYIGIRKPDTAAGTDTTVKYITLEKLIEYAESRKQAFRFKKIKEEKAATREKVLQQLNRQQLNK